jgi:hypothetical protein
MATDMDVLSAAFEAADVDPENLEDSATLRTAALRLAASFIPWLRAGGTIGEIHQLSVEEVQLAANNYDGTQTFTV